jgi:hypothetical protein
MDIRHLVVVAAAALCAACAGPLPVRTVLDAPSSGAAPATCNPSAGSVDPACAHRAHEHASECISDVGVRSDRGYDLHFVEVDDQGALYRAPRSSGALRSARAGIADAD